jgi:pimeloyl-ACP methyl ester carboxylesterase
VSFTWSGGYSHGARRADAQRLKQWISHQGLVRPDFFAHSHGGTVAHLASRDGAEFDRLVLMGLPVHGEWFPDFANINRIIDVRVRFDLVIMADRGGQRFRTNQFNIEEHRHGWFDHSSTHESAYWDNHGLWNDL